MSRGISTRADALHVTVDGVDLTATLWPEIQAAYRVRNETRDNLLSLFAARTTAPAEAVAQTLNYDDFEEASEFGVPKSLRASADVLLLAYGFRWFDAASRFTWRALVDMDAAQVSAQAAAILEADNRLVYKACFGALLNNTQRLSPENLPIYPLYSGDGSIPPEHAAQVFTGTHTHYLTSQANVVDGNDVVELTRHITHHGYGDPSRGSRVLVLCHPNEAEVLRGVTKGATSSVDFVTAEGAPAFLTTQTLVGDRPPANLGRVPIFGSLGSAWLSENALVPAGYLLAVVVNADGTAQEAPLAIREHVRPELRGLRQVAGGDSNYPLQDSIASRGFGTGVRKRGAAAVMQITTNANYTVPAEYATVLA